MTIKTVETVSRESGMYDVQFREDEGTEGCTVSPLSFPEVLKAQSGIKVNIEVRRNRVVQFKLVRE